VEIITNTIGIVGVGFIVFAYFMVQFERLKSTDVMFPSLNLCGAVLILFSLFWHWNLPSVVIEVIWIGISLMGIRRNMKK